MASLQDKKIKDTFQGLLKTEDNEVLTGASKELTDGEGNGSGLHLNTAGDFKADGTLEFGNLKDTTEDITITKFVDEADGIANNDNDTTIPTSAAVKDYVDNNITAQDLDFAGDSGIGAVDLDSQSLNLVGTNGVVTSASGQTITIDTSSLDTRLTTAEADIDTNTADIATEEAARIAADNTLQSNIDSEEAARISADNTLQANINTEATTRATADTTLQSNIDSEAATRLANDTTLQGNIDAEETARIAADSNLQSQITSNDGDITTLQSSKQDNLTAGTGIDLTANTVTNTAPDQTVTLTEGNNVTITGTYPNFTISSSDVIGEVSSVNAGTGISVDSTTGNVTVTNTSPDQTVTLTGSGATNVSGIYPDFTVSSTDTTYTAGTGIDVTSDIITNTAPDQTVSITSSGSATVTGTYPNFNVDAADTNTTYTAGSGLDLTGTVFSNTAPDQTVAITGSGSTTITGTYPNFNVDSIDTQYTAGIGIDVTGTTITNTSPDQTVTITEGNNITVTGSYPDFIITAASSTAPVASVNGEVGVVVLDSDDIAEGITNLYDKTVTITEGSNITVTGVYPNFTIDASVPTVPVDSVNGQTGVVVLDSDDVSQGATNLYNQTHTGDVTGATALTIASGAVTNDKMAVDSVDSAQYVDGSIDTVHLANDVINYAKLGTEFTTSAALATDVDFSTAQVFTKTLAADTTLTFSNDAIGMVKDLVITGDHALTLPAGSTVAGTYDGTVSNLIQVVVTGASEYWFSISQAQ